MKAITLSDVDSILEVYANNISKEIIERKVFDVEEIKLLLKIRLLFFFNEYMRMLSDDMDDEYRRLKILVQSKSTPVNKIEGYKKRLIDIKGQRANINRGLTALKEYDEYRQLKIFVRDKYGCEVIEDFYHNYLNNNDFLMQKKIDKLIEKFN